MVAKATRALNTADGLLKGLLVLSRTVDHALEGEAVKQATNEKLSASKVQILRLLGMRGSHTSTQIARFLSVSKPAVTQLIDSMVRRKLVMRRTAKFDRREVDLRLTERGKKVCQAVRNAQRNMLRSAARQIGGAGADQWIKVLEELTNALAMAGRAYERYCMQCEAFYDGTCAFEGGQAPCPFRECGWAGPRTPETRLARLLDRGRIAAAPERRR